MTVVVGYTPGKGGRGSLDLGLQLAHALDEPMAVVTVVPRQWSTPSMARVDAEYGEFARQVGEEAERQARAYLVDTETTVKVDLTYLAVTGRSIASALIDAVGQLDGTVLVLGSSADGQVGRVVVGSTADKLLHASPVPLATRGGWSGSMRLVSTRVIRMPHGSAIAVSAASSAASSSSYAPSASACVMRLAVRWSVVCTTCSRCCVYSYQREAAASGSATRS